MSYWRKVVARAAREAASEVKLSPWTSGVIVMGSQVLVSVILLWGTVVTQAALWTRVVAVVAPFVAFPIAFFIKLLTVPAALNREAELRLEALHVESDARVRKRAIKGMVGRFLRSGNEILRTKSKDDEALREPAVIWVTSVRDFLAAAFGSGEAELALSDAGYTFLGGGKYENWIIGRLRRLQELMARADSMEPDGKFDLSKWE
jgi:hypothetical protein